MKVLGFRVKVEVKGEGLKVKGLGLKVNGEGLCVKVRVKG